MTLALELWSASHLAVLAVTVFVAVSLVAASRFGGAPWLPGILAVGLAALLAVTKLAVLIWAITEGRLAWTNGLPMHLCDWATFAAILALVTRWQIPYELTWFWGLGGTLQAMITPDLAFEFPHFGFIMFFLSHAGILVAALFLTFGFRMRPKPGAIWRMMLLTNAYVAAAFIANGLIDANYGYLRAKPLHPSLLDYLGPWPWYLLVLEALALFAFALLYSPFYLSDRIGRDR
jgi:hypothetical integral membrane protein (TIGR02206 family)